VRLNRSLRDTYEPEHWPRHFLGCGAITTATDVYSAGVLLFLLLGPPAPLRLAGGNRAGDLRRDRVGMALGLPIPCPVQIEEVERENSMLNSASPQITATALEALRVNLCFATYWRIDS